MNSDLAILVRTVVILVVTVLIVSLRAEWRRPGYLPPALDGVPCPVGDCYHAVLALLSRALKIGPASGVVSVDKLSVVLVVALAALSVGERLTWHVGLGAVVVALGAMLVSVPMSS